MIITIKKIAIILLMEEELFIMVMLVLHYHTVVSGLVVGVEMVQTKEITLRSHLTMLKNKALNCKVLSLYGVATKAKR